MQQIKPVSYATLPCHGSSCDNYRMEKRRILPLTGAIIVVAALAVLVLTVARPKPAPKPVPPALNRVLLSEARPLSAFTLTDMNGEPFDLSRLQGKWSFLFFGYTHCPDICPTTLATLKLTAKKLQVNPDLYRDTQFVFISVDPKRDTLALLKKYVAYFSPDFLAATADKTHIDALARQVGAIYMFDGDTSGDDYIVNHSPTIVLIDPKGRWVARFNPPHSATKIADDFIALRDYLNND